MRDTVLCPPERPIEFLSGEHFLEMFLDVLLHGIGQELYERFG